ncbi:hypothetical protein TcWFU_006964 [Taenia crassiceps]|uniref:Uncharacterized protein n=1 Tax=Taenia crassiceps TaxID=6207 RepID=A0ABR4Q8A4_9CEST
MQRRIVDVEQTNGEVEGCGWQSDIAVYSDAVRSDAVCVGNGCLLRGGMEVHKQQHRQRCDSGGRLAGARFRLVSTCSVTSTKGGVKRAEKDVTTWWGGVPARAMTVGVAERFPAVRETLVLLATLLEVEQSNLHACTASGESRATTRCVSRCTGDVPLYPLQTCRRQRRVGFVSFSTSSSQLHYILLFLCYGFFSFFFFFSSSSSHLGVAPLRKSMCWEGGGGLAVADMVWRVGHSEAVNAGACRRLVTQTHDPTDNQSITGTQHANAAIEGEATATELPLTVRLLWCVLLSVVSDF